MTTKILVRADSLLGFTYVELKILSHFDALGFKFSKLKKKYRNKQNLQQAMRLETFSLGPTFRLL